MVVVQGGAPSLWRVQIRALPGLPSRPPSATAGRRGRADHNSAATTVAGEIVYERRELLVWRLGKKRGRGAFPVTVGIPGPIAFRERLPGLDLPDIPRLAGH